MRKVAGKVEGAGNARARQNNLTGCCLGKSRMNTRVKNAKVTSVPVVALMGALVLMMLPARLVWAAPAKHAKLRTIQVTIDKGETYVIEGVSKSATPRIKVEANPNALVVRTDAPGRIVLVGADSGSWNLVVTLASGEKVNYAVSVKALGPPQGSLSPASAPTAIP
jgi:hypothetical protein